MEKYGDSCLGCKICEVVCSSRWCDEFRPKASAIKVKTIGLYLEPQPIVCRSCDDAACISVCPNGCIEKVAGIIRCNQANCTGCMECVQACPLGACTFDDASERVIICDGCEGERLCQKFCPTTVLDRIFAEARV